MTSEDSIFSLGSNSDDPVQIAKAALFAARQYQQDWKEQGVDRVSKYFERVEEDWLENFEPIQSNDLLGKVSGISVSDISCQLKLLGLSRYFIKEVVFPSWWNNELEPGDEAISMLLQSLAKRLLLEINFQQGSSNLLLNFSPIPKRKFKLRKGSVDPELFGYLAKSVASNILSSFNLPYTSIPSDASEIRDSILERYQCVSLESLLDFCWTSGIPVVHFDLLGLFGQGNSKPRQSDGLVFMDNGRPVIVIGSSRKHSAWLLFILAHELGHIACGHLQDGILSDESIESGEKDEEEEEANQFAIQLLFGNSSLQWNSGLRKEVLLKKAKQLSKQYRIDAGTVILDYAWQTGYWGGAVATLNLLEPDANAPSIIQNSYQGKLISVDEDRRDYLEKLKVLSCI